MYTGVDDMLATQMLEGFPGNILDLDQKWMMQFKDHTLAISRCVAIINLYI